MTNSRQSPTRHRVSVVCDFDGTISLGDVTDGLLDRFAVGDWARIEDQWLAGLIGSRECMANQVAMIEASRADLDAWLDEVRIDPGFPEFVRACERGGVALKIASDGIDYAIRRILANNGLAGLEVAANALVALPGDRYKLEFPHATADCEARAGMCKCRLAADSQGPTILIGDGTSDVCVASNVDFVFAKDRLLAHCRAHAIAHAPFESFVDVERALAATIECFMPPHHDLPFPENPIDA